MTTKISNSSLVLTSTLICDITFFKYGLVKEFQAELTSTGELDLVSSTVVTLNLETLEIPWQLGATYSFTIQEGFMKDISKGVEELSPASSFNFTAPSSPPTLQSSVPANLSTGVLENVTLVLNYDRNIYKGTGNIYLYKNGSPDTLIYTINMSNSQRVLISGNQLILNITGQFQQANTYYLLADAGILLDVWKFQSTAITNENTIRSTMATSLEDPTGLLKEVSTSITTARRYLQGSATGLFNTATTFTSTQPTWSFVLTSPAVFTSAQYKFGNASFYPSTGRLAVTPTTPNTITGDYTVEYWYKTPMDMSTDAGFIIDTRDDSNTSLTGSFNSSIEVVDNTPGDNTPSQWQMTHLICGVDTGISQYEADGWAHIAFVKSGNTLKGFKNGNLIYTNNNFTTPLPFRSTGFRIGSNYANAFPPEGYIDDLKISSSAKYSENFVAPTQQATSDVEDYVLVLNFNLVSSSPSYSAVKRISNSSVTITDLNIDSNLTYSAVLTCTFGKFSYNASTPSYSLTLTGTKSSVNSQLALVTFTPDSGVTSTGNITYVQKRNDETRETEIFVISSVSAG
jgi:hypothetical protein